jgi:hypothetical protein
LGPVVAVRLDHVLTITVYGLAARTAHGTAQKLGLLVTRPEALAPPAGIFCTRRWRAIDHRLRLPSAVLRLAGLLVLPIVLVLPIILGLAIMPLVTLVPVPAASLVVAAMLALLRPSIVAALLVLKARLILLMAGRRWLLALADIVNLLVRTVVPLAALRPYARTACAVHLAGLHLLLAVR